MISNQTAVTGMTDPDRSNHEVQQQSRLKLLEEARKELLSNSLLAKLISDQHPMAMNSSDACDKATEEEEQRRRRHFHIFIIANVRI